MKITNLVVALAAIGLVHAVRLGDVDVGTTTTEADATRKTRSKASLRSGGGGSALRR